VDGRCGGSLFLSAPRREEGRSERNRDRERPQWEKEDKKRQITRKQPPRPTGTSLRSRSVSSGFWLCLFCLFCLSHCYDAPPPFAAERERHNTRSSTDLARREGPYQSVLSFVLLLSLLPTLQGRCAGNAVARPTRWGHLRPVGAAGSRRPPAKGGGSPRAGNIGRRNFFVDFFISC
jgi:hypothetical protein